MSNEYVIVSLSTIPPRFGKLQPVLNTLLDQTLKADEICIYVPQKYKRFGSYDMRQLKVPKGVSVKVVEEDLGPATKVLPCIQENQGKDVCIVYCDDDRLYARTWLEALVGEMVIRPNHAVTASGMQLSRDYQITEKGKVVLPRAVRKKVKYDWNYLRQRILQGCRFACGLHAPKPHRKLYETGGYVDFAMGVGGVALRPDYMPETAFRIPEIAWPVDDIWLSGCLRKNGVLVWASDKAPMPTAAEASDIAGLAGSIFGGLSRHENDRACIEYIREEFGIWV